MADYFRPYINKDDYDKGFPENSPHILAKSRGGSDRQENRIKLYYYKDGVYRPRV